MICFNPDKTRHRLLYQAKGQVKALNKKGEKRYIYYTCGNHYHVATKRENR